MDSDSDSSTASASACVPVKRVRTSNKPHKSMTDLLTLEANFDAVVEGLAFGDVKVNRYEFHVKHQTGSKSAWHAILLCKDGGMLYLYLDSSFYDRDPEGIRYNLTIWLGSETIPIVQRANEPMGRRWRSWTVLNHFPLTTLVDLFNRGDRKLRDEKTLRIRIMFEILDGETSPQGMDVGQKLLNDPEFADVTLRCGSEEIKAHKSVLACGSEVFRTMFASSGMSEAISGVVLVDDLDFSTLNLILRYIYTGKVTELDPEMTLEVIYGAEKYGLEGLKKHCFSQLVVCVDDDSVGPLAVAAHLYKAQPEVVKIIHNHVAHNFLKRVKHSPGLRRLVERYPAAFFS